VNPTNDASRFPDPTAADLRAVAAFKEALSRPDLLVGTWHGGVPEHEGGPIQWPWVQYGSVVSEWVDALYEHHVVVDYGEPGWDERMQAFATDPTRMQAADLLTVRKVLTTVVRRERFCDGSIQSAFGTGLVQAAMLRLRELADALRDGEAIA